MKAEQQDLFAQRDAVLDAIEVAHEQPIAIAKRHRDRIHRERGRVTSVEVRASMEAAGEWPHRDEADPRFMGALFRKGWVRIGFEPTASHGRPAAIWKVK